MNVLCSKKLMIITPISRIPQHFIILESIIDSLNSSENLNSVLYKLVIFIFIESIIFEVSEEYFPSHHGLLN